MSKHHDKQRRGAGLSSLRPRLDQLLHGEDFDQLDQHEVLAQLNTLTTGIKPATALPIVLASSSAAPLQRQSRLGELLPRWLETSGLREPLHDLIVRHALGDDMRQLALAWLASAGADTGALVAELDAWESFYDAYYAGNPSQASLMIFWYTNRRQQRVHGIGLLLDYEPPWDGAVKDGLRYPQRTPQDAIDQFVEVWERRGEATQRLTAVEAKRRAIQAFERNRQANIRLHPDLVAARDLVVHELLALPDGPDTPPFSAADFDELASTGQHPEALRRQEQMFGYRARTADGQEIRIIRGPEDF
jgi:hypothetical protein